MVNKVVYNVFFSKPTLCETAAETDSSAGMQRSLDGRVVIEITLFHGSIADTFDYNVVEAHSITSNRTDANVVYLTVGSKKTSMCKRTVNNVMPR